MPHNNISIFIPHLGCKHLCSFCNQRDISGTQNAPSPKEVEAICEEAYNRITDRKNTEIAFFGGSFTAIPKDYMISLLECVQRFIGPDGFCGVRISTRPDCIDEEILAILKKYNVKAIELGAQSMCNKVLSANERGHTREDVISSSKLIKDNGFELGLQMMTGLYKSSPKLDMYTADCIIKIRPKTVRIYPTVILKGTALADKFISGEYKTVSLDEMVDLCAEILQKFLDSGIRVIKLGLHSSETVGAEMVGGYYHQAFRELCEGKIFRNNIKKYLKDKNIKYTVAVARKSISKALGQRKANVDYFLSQGYKIKFVQDDSLKDFEIKVTGEV